MVQSRNRLISIDSSSTCTGYAVWENGELLTYACIDLRKNKNTQERLLTMCKEILRVLHQYSPSMVYIEEPDGMSISAYKLLVKILGVVYGWCIDHNIYYEEVKPVSWRSWIGINQSGKKRPELKKLDMEYVQAKYGIDVKGIDDIADAICIGQGVLNKYRGNHCG